MQTSFFLFSSTKKILWISLLVIFFGGGVLLLMLLFCENIHLSMLLFRLPMLFDLSKYTEFGEHKNGE